MGRRGDGTFCNQDHRDEKRKIMKDGNREEDRRGKGHIRFHIIASFSLLPPTLRTEVEELCVCRVHSPATSLPAATVCMCVCVCLCL